MKNTMVQKVFRQMTATQIASAVTVTVCLLVDSIIIGRYLGVDAMSAYGFANPALIIFNALGTMVACGVQVVLGKAMGRGDTEECNRCYSTSIVMSLAMAAIWMLLVFAASGPLCVMLGAGTGEVAGMTADYLKGYMLGAPFYFLSQIMIPYLQVMGRRKLTLASVAVMTISDVVLDLLNVHVFDDGMFGIGLASGLSYLAATLTGIVFFLKKDCKFKFKTEGISPASFKEIIIGGNPIAVNQAFFMIRVYALNRILMAVSGTVAVAALSVISTVGNIFFSVGVGAGSIALMLASIFHSEEDRKSIYELIVEMTLFSSKLILVLVIVVQIFAPQLIDLFFAGSPEVTEIAVTALRLYIISIIACVLTTVYKNYYQGTGRVKFTNVISFFDNVGILIPITWVFSLLMGLWGVWLGILIAQFGTLIFISAVVWFRYGKVSFSAEAYSMLNPDFGAKAEDIFEANVTDMDSAIEASKDVNSFCEHKGLGQRMSMLLSLCVEEILANIVWFGFQQDNKSHNAEVKLVVHDDCCKVRIRDDCAGFDPTHYFELHKSDSPTEHIGLRMVMAMTNEVNYINSLGLNNLYMRIDS